MDSKWNLIRWWQCSGWIVIHIRLHVIHVFGRRQLQLKLSKKHYERPEHLHFGKVAAGAHTLTTSERQPASGQPF